MSATVFNLLDGDPGDPEGREGHVYPRRSVRPLPGAPVATPLAWEALDDDLDPLVLNVRTMPNRVARPGDLHAPLLSVRQRLRVPARSARR